MRIMCIVLVGALGFIACGTDGTSGAGTSQGGTAGEANDAGQDGADASVDDAQVDAGDGQRPDADGLDGATEGDGDPSDSRSDLLVELCGSVPRTLDDWEDCDRRRRCAWILACDFQTQWVDVAECVTSFDDANGRAGWVARRARARAIAAGRAQLNEAAFTECLLDLEPSRCVSAAWSRACAARFSGSIEDGSACSVDEECRSLGARCARVDDDDPCTVGTCVARYREGERCDEFLSCEPGLPCHGTCRAGTVGSACASPRDCGPGTWCDQGLGRCAVDLPLGAACTSTLQCSGGADCIGLSIVNADPGRCQLTAREGDRCDFLCRGALACEGGRCVPLPRLGAACGFPGCAGANATCRDARCVLRGAVGADCIAESCAFGSFCSVELGASNPTCAAPLAPGAICTRDGQCESGYCTGSEVRPGKCADPSATCANDGGRGAP
jgi:hypothetical protein